MYHARFSAFNKNDSIETWLWGGGIGAMEPHGTHGPLGTHGLGVPGASGDPWDLVDPRALGNPFGDA